MARKKKKGAAAKARRASLNSFARGKFQSPVHSNGFKQDVLIDLYGGDTGFVDTGTNAPSIAADMNTAGKTYVRHGGVLKKVVSAGRGHTLGEVTGTEKTTRTN